MELLDRRDVLASNLLFGTLLVSGAELAGPWLLGWLSPHRDYLPVPGHSCFRGRGRQPCC